MAFTQTDSGVNKYNTSNLVATDVLNLLGEMTSVILSCAGEAHTDTFDEKRFIPGLTIGYQVAGIPTVKRSMAIDTTATGNLQKYEQRTLYIKADVDRWFQSVSHSFLQYDDIYLTNPKLRQETVSAPTVRALKESLEYEGAAFLREHTPVLPSFGSAINEPITLPTYFDYSVINYLEKLRNDLQFPMHLYRLILSTSASMYLASSLQNMYNEKINSLTTTTGRPPSKVAGFTNCTSPYVGLHGTNLTQAQKDDPAVETVLRFPLSTNIPSSDENPVGVLYNDTNANIILTAGDIIYHLADSTTQSSGLYWIQNTIKRLIPDSRYAFCVTSDRYIEGFKLQVALDTGNVLKTSWAKFSYEKVRYKITANSQTIEMMYLNSSGEEQVLSIGEISLSHRVIDSGYHQNVSRTITPGTTSGDKFIVLPDHYKNFAVHPEYFKFKSFRLPPLKATEHAEVNDPKSGIKMLITHDRILETRSNIFDISTLNAWGAVPQNLFCLPMSIDVSDFVQLIGKV